MPYHRAAQRNETFRNPDGVAFKLQNLHKVATGKGLGNVSQTDRAVWAEFSRKPEEVDQVSQLIRASPIIVESQHDIMDSESEEEFFEGRLLTEFHKKKERHPGVRTKLLASRRKHGPLVCDMCFRKAKTDEPKFEDAIFEAHHLLPMAMAMERRTRLKDMALLCANCHRLLHRAISLNKRWLTIKDGRRIVGLICAPAQG